ncbi:beta-phosphoglucomutase [Leptothoe sp. PORK10 BA2]|uniref:beta-phosphoglucomutase n=1 Tax=Leptothoe sp. PORK10 BA2 TaxID=3110254 RepID=UPI002B213294|nr:beta-phosphoglucomutase [Leptothoe sp. PORK10 BA2]MEA5466278.1 beta-phosphoglucomutase [Leptothoe sp. PORK10 BA2]
MVKTHQTPSQPTFANVSDSYQYQPWSITETHLDVSRLNQRETVFTIGNGYLGTRGNFEEGYGSSLPMTLIHGVYDDVPVMYTELANCPDWLSLAFLIEGERFTLDTGEILAYERTLDVRCGLLTRHITWRSPQGKELTFRFERFASLADCHQLNLRCEVTPLNFTGAIEVRASLNGYPANQGYNHWAIVDQGQRGEHVWLHTKTQQTQIDVAMAMGLRVLGLGQSATIDSLVLPGYPTWVARYQGQPHQTVTFEKQVVVFSSHEQPAPLAAALDHGTPSYEQSKLAHIHAWNNLWDQCDVLIEGDVRAQFALRYSLFQILICAPAEDEHVSIPAKTLSGTGYRGHVFWDTELFILPFLVYTQPQTARNLLTYRYHTLAGARRKAHHYGYKGAMFAWESAASGDEVTPRWAVPRDPYGQDVRIWCRDRALHITADIAYASWQYWRATGDDHWMACYGAEMILDGAQFWTSRVTHNPLADRYEICEVVGPDEYHEKVDNNAYTNRMVQWHLDKAIQLYDWLQHHDPQRAAHLDQQLGISDRQRARWQDIVDHIWIPMQGDLVEQCDGFFELQDIDLASYEPRTLSMHSILGVEQSNHYQVLKQPDVLMLMYLMRAAQEFPYGHLEQNWNYYAPRTDITYGSSLGPTIHAVLAADLGLADEAYDRFMQAVLVDLEDVRGNAAEGIHGASAGSVWQAAILGFGGVKFTDQGPVANPHLPAGWTRLKFKLQWRGNWYHFDLQPDHGTVAPAAFVPLSCATVDIRGVIFDLDGVLTDTAEFHYQAWQQLADEIGVPFNREINESLRGVSRQDSLLRILGDHQYSASELEVMMVRKNDHYTQLIEQINPAHVLPGVIRLLDQLQQAGIKLAVGSASKNARAVIQRLGIESRFDAIADGHSVTRSKPAPDLFLYAAQQLQLPPHQCIVIEDAAAGVEAAIAAGMWTVGLGPAERVGKAALVLPNLSNSHWLPQSHWPTMVDQLKQAIGN